jgi:tetratricopeptide (TPR) repeat protein
LGYAYYKLKQAGPSIDAYNKSIRYNPNYLAAYRGLADTYFDLSKDYVTAAGYYRKALTFDPDNPGALYRLGYCENDAGNYQAAVTHLARAEQMKPEWENVSVELGYAYWKTGRSNEAVRAFTTAIGKNRQSELARYYLGMVYVENGNRNAAMQQYRDLQRMNSQYAQKLSDAMNKR